MSPLRSGRRKADIHRMSCALQGILYNYIGCYTWISATYDVNGRFFAVNGKKEPL